MKKLNETDALNEMIINVQQQYQTDLFLLKEQAHIAYESIKPVNLIKNLVHDVTSSPQIQEDVFGNVLGLVTGFISRKLMIHEDSSMFKKVLATVAQFAIANVVSKHSIDIKAAGTAIFNNFLRKKH
ncbi:hypothetical protein [Flavobacterium aestuarii]|uniref:hypothetical protein n=1 Tax=Flavobacterium aestuarii TaxID=3149227 RepID=UPI0032B60874